MADAVVSLVVNGREENVHVPNDETLLETLRDRCGLTSVRYSCGIGVCGSCTVLIDGHAVSACLLLTRMVDGEEITTAETPRPDEGLEDVRRAFVQESAYQCSYCIPAMALTTYSIMRESPDASLDECRDLLTGNLCRCGCYPQVVNVLERLRTRSGSDNAAPEEKARP